MAFLRSWFGGTLGCVSCLFFAMAGAANAEFPATSADRVTLIVKSWKERAAAVRSYDFHLAGTEFIPHKVVSASDLILTGQAQGTEPFSLPDITFPLTMSLVADPGRMRLDIDGKTWSAKEKSYIPQAVVDIFDGKVRKLFFKEGPVGFPNVHIQEGNASELVGDVRILPLMIIYRPLESDMGEFDSASLKLTNNTGIADGRECLILQSGESTVWVDAERVFLPTRYYRIRRGKLLQSIEIQYAADAANGWVPAGWTNALFDLSGQLSNSTTVAVTEHHINIQIPDDTFDLDYPSGTWVRNHITDERYLVRDGGKKRPIQLGEFDGTNYQQILHSEPPGQTSRGWWFFAILGVNLALLMGIFLTVYYRRRKQKPT